MPNVRASSGMISTIREPAPCPEQVPQDRVKTIVVETAVSSPRRTPRPPRPPGWQRGRPPLRCPGRTASAFRPRGTGPPRIGARVIVRRVLELRVRDRQLETVAEDLQLGLDLLAPWVMFGPRPRAQRPALHRCGPGSRWGRRVPVAALYAVDLAVIVAARRSLAGSSSEMLDELAQRGSGPKSGPGCRRRRRAVLLELAVGVLFICSTRTPWHSGRGSSTRGPRSH
jgi:hypothetical protein